MCTELTGATYYMAATARKLLPFPASATKHASSISPSTAPKIGRQGSVESHLIPVPEVTRPRRLLESVGNYQELLTV